MCMSVAEAGLCYFCQKDLQRDGKSRGGSGIYGDTPRCQQLQEKIERRRLWHVRDGRKTDHEGLGKETAWNQVQKW